MKVFGKILGFLKSPNRLFIIIMLCVTIAGCALTVVGMQYIHSDELPLAGFSIFGVIGAYCIIVICIKARRLYKEKYEQRIKNTRIGNFLLENYSAKTVVFAIFSVAISLAFAVMNGVSAIKYMSVWYCTLTCYYLLLIMFRAGVILSDRKLNKKYIDDEQAYERSKLQTYLGSGIFLLVLEVAMVGAVVQTVQSSQTGTGQVMAIATAAYAFYKMTLAIVNMVKAKKRKNPITQALRNLNLADACMSMVSLTVLMIATFGTAGELGELKILVGIAACATVAALAITVIVRTAKKLKMLKEKDCALQSE